MKQLVGLALLGGMTVAAVAGIVAYGNFEATPVAMPTKVSLALPPPIDASPTFELPAELPVVRMPEMRIVIPRPKAPVKPMRTCGGWTTLDMGSGRVQPLCRR